jgi:dTDP-glucose 4,6-dehydratase
MTTTILVTGGAGFIGSHYVRHLLRAQPDVRVVNVDALTYSGNLENLVDVEKDARYRFVRADIADGHAMSAAGGGGVDEIVHLAAESHVDRSIEDAAAFLRTNVVGTQVLLDLARAWKVKRFVHVSTDEVYGALGKEGKFSEETPLAPNSPYAASKAASDLLVRAACHTHGLPAMITRCSNNYGPHQFPEKLIPLMITNALEDEQLPVYGDGMQVRDWIHVEDHCRGLEAVRTRGKPGEVYNLGGNGERPNLEIVRTILRELGKPETLIRHVADRPGHDRRYAIDASKARRDLAWEPKIGLAEGLAACVRWYRDHADWWRRVKSGEYQDYYRRHYAARLGGAS